MITITNRKDKFIVDEKELKKDKTNLNLVGEDEFCEILMSFVYRKKLFKKSIVKIQKCLSSAGYSRGDILRDYKNRIISENKIVLNDEDYKEVVRIITNLRKHDTRRKKLIINSYAPLIAYECNRYFVLSELDEPDINYIFNDVCCGCLYYLEKRKYRKEILEKAKDILKKEYKVDLDYLFDGGKEE